MYGFSWDPARGLAVRAGAEYTRRLVVPLPASCDHVPRRARRPDGHRVATERPRGDASERPAPTCARRASGRGRAPSAATRAPRRRARASASYGCHHSGRPRRRVPRDDLVGRRTRAAPPRRACARGPESLTPPHGSCGAIARDLVVVEPHHPGVQRRGRCARRARGPRSTPTRRGRTRRRWPARSPRRRRRPRRRRAPARAPPRAAAARRPGTPVSTAGANHAPVARRRRSAASRRARPRRRAARARARRARRVVSGPTSVSRRRAGRRRAAPAPARPRRRGSGRGPRARRTRARSSRAACPALANAPHATPRDRALERRVGEHEHRVLARRATSVLGFSARAHASPTSRPTSAEPVSRTWSTGDVDERAAGRRAAVDDPQQALGQPGARERRARSARRTARADGDGLSTTPLPANSAIATSPSGCGERLGAGRDDAR